MSAIADALVQFITEFSFRYGAALTIIACGIALETISIREQQDPWSRVRGALFWAMYILGTVIAVVLVGFLVSSLGLRPLLSLDLRPLANSENVLAAAAGLAIVPIIPILAADFLYYWFHRLQHAVPFLWRFHQVHHAIEELNAANSAHHLSEEIFKIPFIVIPLVLLVEIKVTEIPLVAGLVAGWATLVHTNTRITFGPFNYIVSWPQYHRVHHSRDERHHNKNFASVFSFWDALFGTAYRPRDDEVIKTGLADVREPRTLREHLFALAPRQIGENRDFTGGREAVS
jgi:sterol desaturase/sphingolipid hydroxylase (fatty acid hydroxylase superfamily)